MNNPNAFTNFLRNLDDVFQAFPKIQLSRLLGSADPIESAAATNGEQPAGPAGTGKTASSQQPKKEEDWQDILGRWAKSIPRSSIPQLPAPPSFPGQPYHQANPYTQVYMQYGPYDPYGRY